MKINSGKQHRPRRVLLYGDNGGGKTTLACEFPKPIVLNLEDGSGDVEADKTDWLRDEPSVIGAISWLLTNDHDYKTVVVDTVDWLEGYLCDVVCQQQNVKSIRDIDYGKGPGIAAARWKMLIDGFSRLYYKGMNVVLTCHLAIAKFKDPAEAEYQYYKPKLDDAISSSVIDWCDEVLFCTTRVNTISEDAGFNKKRHRAIGGTERIIFTTEAASHVAKNRLGMPPVLSMGRSSREAWQAIEPFMVRPTDNVATA